MARCTRATTAGRAQKPAFSPLQKRMYLEKSMEKKENISQHRFSSSMQFPLKKVVTHMTVDLQLSLYFSKDNNSQRRERTERSRTRRAAVKLSDDHALSKSSVVLENMFHTIVATIACNGRRPGHGRVRVDQTGVGVQGGRLHHRRFILRRRGRAATVELVLNRRVRLVSNVMLVVEVLVEHELATRRNDDFRPLADLAEPTTGMPNKYLRTVCLRTKRRMRTNYAHDAEQFTLGG